MDEQTKETEHLDTSDQVLKLRLELKEVRKQVDRLQDSDARHDNDIRELYKQAEGTKVYVTQILSTIQQLETKLFGLVTNLTTQQDSDRKAERDERSKASDTWIGFSKYVIGATIGVIVLYLFQQGAK